MSSKNFERIVTREPFEGTLPTQVVLPESVLTDNGILVTQQVTYTIASANWKDALKRFMFLNGWCLPEDNEREMKNLALEK